MIREFLSVLDDRDAKPARGHLALLVCYAVLHGIVFVLLVPVLRALFAGDLSTAWTWIAVLAGVTAVTCVVHYAQSMYGFDVGLKMTRALHRRLGDHVAALPLGWFSGNRVGRLGQLATTGVWEVTGLPAHLIRPLVMAVVTPATIAVAMLFFDWRMALALVLGAPVIYVGYRVTSRLLVRTEHEIDAAAAEFGGRAVEFAQNQAVLRACGRAESGYRALDDAIERQHEVGTRQIRVGVPALLLFAVSVQLVVAAVFVVGVSLALGASLGVPELLALLVLVTRFVDPIVATAELGAAMRAAGNSLGRIREVLETPPLPEPAGDAALPGGERFDIEFDDVRFAYEGQGGGDGAADGRAALAGAAFRIPAGTTTALVGPSGSGKSTVVRLIARFWDVDGGAVRIGGADVRDIPTERLMALIAPVFQDVYLFDATIEENIRIGRPTATEAEVREAGRLARVDEIAERLPDGWRSRVGEGGAVLSGGERQRVSLARAILKDAPIVLLDEATAALDPRNEVAVQQSLATMSGRTKLIIAHRLRTIVHADQIIFLDGGEPVEIGTHEQLLAADGRYARFWRDRNRARGWRLVKGGGAR
ncbi:ABC transporter ATP-binding protein [Saccharothrix xinjiangensis]|uniref:ABC transporter ATP-binding protein n=1 Tax=Saccharothrix xinjiangensis TaxID=204798 RepID=A0ABV9Y3S5_9PSEU